jgi:hypothetical protein
LNMPVTPVTDIAVSQGDLVLSTNGRSFWILDDITPLRELARQPPSTTHLFTPRDTYRLQTSAEEADDEYVFGECCVANARDLYGGARIERHQLGEDPPDGAIVYASLAGGSEPVALSVLDAKGQTIRTIFDTKTSDRKNPTLAAGMNRFNWDLRADAIDVGRPGNEILGPRVPPGTYRLKLTAGGKDQTAAVKVLMDARLARVRVTAEDLQRQYDLLTQIKVAIGDVQRAAKTIRDRRAQAVTADAAALTALERELVGGGERGGGGGERGGPSSMMSDLTSLYGFVADSEDKPTAAALARWAELKKSLDEKLARVSTQTSPGQV